MSSNGKVLFIVHDVYQEDNHFPLGYAYMGAMLKRKGYHVEVCCQDVFHYTNEELAEKFLKNQHYDLIGVGFMAARFEETVLGLCETINKNKKDAWLVLGGPGASAIPEYVLKKTGADVAAVGEAEQTIVELLKCKIEGGDRSTVKGIAYRIGNEVIVNERRPVITDLDSIPFPDWSLFPMDKYTTCFKPFRATKKDKALGILTSRGCINRCSFCYRMEKGIRIRSIDNVIGEMVRLNSDYDVSYFYMNDELFVFSKKRVFEFKEALKRAKLKIRYSCSARVDVFDREIVNALKESGCVFVNFGMESSDQKVLDLMNKNTIVEENIKAAEITNSAGVGLGLNFIWGNKGDTEESLKNNVKLIKKYNLYDQLRTTRPVTPYPGSDLYYDAIEQGLLSGPEDFFKKFKNSDLSTVNFTDIPNDLFYKMLFEANKDLVIDHYMHTTKNMEEANRIIHDFYNLYFKGQTKFRGARHYERDK